MADKNAGDREIDQHQRRGDAERGAMGAKQPDNGRAARRLGRLWHRADAFGAVFPPFRQPPIKQPGQRQDEHAEAADVVHDQGGRGTHEALAKMRFANKAVELDIGHAGQGSKRPEFDRVDRRVIPF